MSASKTAANPPVEAPTGPMGDLKISGETQANGDMDPLVEKRRRYSIDLYHYTNDQWQGVRKAIEDSARNRPTVDTTDARTDSSTESSPASDDRADKADDIDARAAPAAAPAV